MARTVRAALVQAGIPDGDASRPIEDIKRDMVETHEALLRQAAAQGAEVVCFQEIFYGPYFPADQDRKWYALTEQVPDGPTTQRFADLARELGLVLVLPVYEEDIDALLEAAVEPLDTMLKLMWENGLRISEAMHLRPADLRPEQNELSIKAHGEFEPKTKKSARTIPVTEETMDQLLELANEVGPLDERLQTVGASGGRGVRRPRGRGTA